MTTPIDLASAIAQLQGVLAWMNAQAVVPLPAPPPVSPPPVVSPPPPPVSPPPVVSPPPPVSPPPVVGGQIPDTPFPSVVMSATISVDPMATMVYVPISLSSPPTTTALIEVITVDGSAVGGYNYRTVREMVIFYAGGPAAKSVAIPLIPNAGNAGKSFELWMTQQENPGTVIGASKTLISFAAGAVNKPVVYNAPPLRTPNKGALVWQFDPATFKASDTGGPGVFRDRFMHGRTQPGNAEQGYYTSPALNPGTRAYEVRNGVLVVRAEHFASPLKVNGAPYYLGYLPGNPPCLYGASVLQAKWLAQQYGYYEWEIQSPSARGSWGAAWLLPASDGWPPEIDVFEHPRNGQVLGNMTTVANHWSDASGGNASHGAMIDLNTIPGLGGKVDLTTGYHTYGLDWRTDYTTYFIDNVAIWQTPTRFHEPAYPLVDNAVGGWGGDPDPAQYPAEMLVRAWRVFK